MRASSPRLHTVLALVSLTLWPFAYFWRATIGEVALLPNDGYRLAYPLKVLAARALLDGGLLLWTPYAFSGFPFFAAMQAGALHPGVWLFCVLPPVVAANLQVILTASGAALGTYVYTRQIGCTRFAAVFGGLTFALGGFMVAHVGHVQMPQGMAVLPWLLWAFDALRAAIRMRVVAAAALAVAAALCAGYAPGFVYVLLVCGPYAGAAALLAGPPSGGVRYLFACTAAVAAGILLAAVQLVPMLELATQSLRTHMDFSYYAQFSLPPAQLPMLLFPFLFGGTSPTPYWGEWNLTELTGYVGIAPVMLAVAAGSLVRHDWRAAFWAGVACVALLLSLGPATPLGTVMYWVPGYNLLRGQARNLFEFDFAVAVLAALALTAASGRALVAGAALVVAAVAGVAAVALVVGASLWLPLAATGRGEFLGRQLVAGLSVSNPGLWLPVVIAAAAAVAVIALARRRAAVGCVLLLVTQLADLEYFGSVLGREYPGIPWLLHPPPVVEAVAGLPLDLGASRVAVLTNDDEALDLRATLWGVPLVNGYDSMPLARYAQFALGMPYWGQILPERAFAKPVFLDLLNARWIVVLHPASAPADGAAERAVADTARWRLHRRTSRYTVLENLLARPRAWLAARTVLLGPDAALDAVRDGRFGDGEAFDPGRVAVIEDGAAKEYGDGASGGEVTIGAYAPGAIEMVTRSDRPAFLVTSEIDYPGWRAYVDETEVPILRTDYVLRGFEVGAGQHRVRMVFAPRSLRVGFAVSALTAATLLLTAIVRLPAHWRCSRCAA